MPFARWAISEFMSYGVWPWVAFVFIAWVSAYTLRGPGVFLGHVLTALVVAGLDCAWIHGEMSKPGWDGQPDQDFVFMIGVVVRVVLINLVLLPVGMLAIRRRGKGAG